MDYAFAMVEYNVLTVGHKEAWRMTARRDLMGTIQVIPRFPSLGKASQGRQIVHLYGLRVQMLLCNTNSYVRFYKQHVQMVTEGGTALQCPIQHYNAWHDGTMPGTTLQCVVQCYNARYDVTMRGMMLQCGYRGLVGFRLGAPLYSTLRFKFKFCCLLLDSEAVWKDTGLECITRLFIHEGKADERGIVH